MMVAPSFVMTMSPMLPTIILSMPRGPMVERTVSARTLAAMILLLGGSFPLDLWVPSLRIMIGISDMLDQIPRGKGANSFRDKPYASLVTENAQAAGLAGDGRTVDRLESFLVT